MRMASILKDGPLRRMLRERKQEEMPGRFGGTWDRLTKARAGEMEVIDDYAELENQLRREGRIADADIVNEIRNDEIDHLGKFEAMIRKLKSE